MADREKYIDFISEALYNTGLDTDDTAWQSSDALRAFINDEPRDGIIALNAESLDLTMENNNVMIIVRIKNDDLDKARIFNELVEKIKINRNPRSRAPIKLNILWIVNNIRTRLRIKKDFSDTKTLKNEFEKATINVRNIFSTYYFDCDSQIYSNEFKLTAKRYEMVSHPFNSFIWKELYSQNDSNDLKAQNDDTNSIETAKPKKSNRKSKAQISEENTTEETDCKKNGLELKGYIFTANLFEIVELYNEIGDELFKKNLRLGIKEQMGVDQAIKETLRDDPEYFWFRNGGIAILINAPDPTLDRTNEIVLKRKDKELNFWVINGAQTINAAADFFYETDKNLSEEKRKKTDATKKDPKDIAKEKAKVIVRVIQIKEAESQDQDHAQEQEADKICVSLNRQKPIKNEDIAFTNPFVYELLNYLEKEKLPYSLCRRSEITYSKNDFSLIEFARARLAYSGKPGDARNKTSASLLKTKTDGGFSETDIFDSDIQNNYPKYYNPIFDAISISRLYERIIKGKENIKIKIPHDKANREDLIAIIKNGKWFFTAFVIYALNKYDATNFENYCYKLDYSNESKDSFGKLIKKFAELFLDVILKKNPSITIDSNLLKKNTEYDNLLKNLEKSKEKMEEFKKALSNWSTNSSS